MFFLVHLKQKEGIRSCPAFNVIYRYQISCGDPSGVRPVGRHHLFASHSVRLSP